MPAVEMGTAAERADAATAINRHRDEQLNRYFDRLSVLE